MILTREKALNLLRFGSGDHPLVKFVYPNGEYRNIEAWEAARLIQSSRDILIRANSTRVKAIVEKPAPALNWSANYQTTEAPVLPVSIEWLRNLYGKPDAAFAA